ncbi:carboxymethylenebutenolidase homolog isoform X2 [Ptychodera flava]
MERPCEAGDVREEYTAAGNMTTVNSNLTAYVSQPREMSCKGAVLVFHDIFGLDIGANRAAADELARNGYTAVLPDLFRGNPWTSSSDWRQFGIWMSGHPQERINNDVDATLEFIEQSLDYDDIGIVGFCWGGTQVILGTARLAARIKAGISFYGSVQVMTPQDILAMRAPTLLVHAENDTVVPLAAVQNQEILLQDANRLLRSVDDNDANIDPSLVTFVKVFEGVEHGFAHRGDRNDPFIMQAAAEAFSDMYTWLDKYLPKRN